MYMSDSLRTSWFPMTEYPNGWWCQTPLFTYIYSQSFSEIKKIYIKEEKNKYKETKRIINTGQKILIQIKAKGCVIKTWVWGDKIVKIFYLYTHTWEKFLLETTSGCLFVRKLEPFNKTSRASLVAQWLRICLPLQGTRVRALVWEDPTCRGATRSVSHNYWACASGACAPQQERPRQWEARAPRWRVTPACHN